MFNVPAIVTAIVKTMLFTKASINTEFGRPIGKKWQRPNWRTFGELHICSKPVKPEAG